MVVLYWIKLFSEVTVKHGTLQSLVSITHVVGFGAVSEIDVCC